MNAEEAMKQIGQILEDYIDDRISEVKALGRIAQATGRYERAKK